MFVSGVQKISAMMREARRDDGPLHDEYGDEIAAEAEAATIVVGYDNEGEAIVEVPAKWREPRPPAPPAPRARGKRPQPNYERRAYVRLLWTRQYATTEIYEIVRERWPTVATRTIDEDIAKLKREGLLRGIEAQDVVGEREKMIATMIDLASEARAAGDRNTARYCYAQIAKMRGLYAPTKVDLNVNQTTTVVPIKVDEIVGALDDAGLRALELVLAQLEAKGLAVVTPAEATPLRSLPPGELEDDPDDQEDGAEGLDDDGSDA